MARFGTLGTRYTNKDGSILTDGVIDFFDSGTNDVKPTFADIDETPSLQNADPFELNADGSQPNCFFTGSAKGILRSLSKGQIDVLDPITASGSEGGRLAFASWNALSTYQKPDLVTASDGLYYKCIVTSSQGNEPSANESDWSEVKFIGVWNTNQDYVLDDVVQASDGYLYINISAGSGDDPITVKASWRALSSQVYDAGTTYKIGEIVSDATGLMWASLVDPNLNNTPSTSPASWKSAFRATITIGITAATTQTQAAATALISDINEISVCANAGDSLKLRAAAPGVSQTLINNGAETARVFPPTGDKINDGAADAADPVLLRPGDIRKYTAIDAENYYSALATSSGGLSAPISTVTAASSATLTVDDTFDGTYDIYLLTANNITFQNTDNDFVCELKIGGSFQTANYFYSAASTLSNLASINVDNSEVATEIILGGAGGIIGNETKVSGNLIMYIFNPTDMVNHVQIQWEFTYVARAASNASNVTVRGSGRYNGGTGALTGVKFFANANGGNLVTGTFRLQGFSK